MGRYEHAAIESKWQQEWERQAVFVADDSARAKNVYVLDMFPYPSADGLHVGHPEGYTATDILSRYLRMKGKNVLHPMGWDAFGLPAENAALKKGIHPSIVTDQNVKNFKRQIRSLGFSYDWSREINTTDPAYYQWTQWIFLQLFRRGLAYQAELPIWWCPKDKTGLANEEVVDGCCERCGTKVEKKQLRQWVLKITEYAERLLDGLEKLDWPESIKALQRNWIGRSEGAEIVFPLRGVTGQVDDRHSATVFTTRPDTIFGATFLVVSPELAQKWMDLGWQASKAVKKYVAQSLVETEIERQDTSKQKTGVDAGIRAVNPATGKEIPVWVADYVLGGYGTGAIMAVPAHDERDNAFAKKFKLPIVNVIEPEYDVLGSATYDPSLCWIGEGTLINSGEFVGLASAEARVKIVNWLKKSGQAEPKVQYKLRDWVFSRQRYWGEPIPLVHCEKDGVVPVPEKELPVMLPNVEKYEPTGTGESPLAAIGEWVNTTCPKCHGPARRETNTMPQWAGSCWYYLRYLDPKNEKKLADPKKLKAWLPVDVYIGGAEHAVLHLMYARFWHKVLYDAGAIPKECGDEPFLKLKNQGLILGEDGEKMSKSRGNVINPDEIVEKFGADSLRLFEMFMGPFEDAKPWSTQGIVGVRRFLDRVWQARELVSADRNELPARAHRYIASIARGIEEYKFNTCVSDFMKWSNEWNAAISVREFEAFLKAFSAFAPHLAEELWNKLGHMTLIAKESWPTYDETMLKTETVTIAIQVNGKMRGTVDVETDADQSAVEAAARSVENVKKNLSGSPKKIIFVKNRLINFIV